MSLKLIYIEIHFLSFFILFMHVLSCAEQQGLIFNVLPLYFYPIDEPSEITLIYFGFFFKICLVLKTTRAKMTYFLNVCLCSQNMKTINVLSKCLQLPSPMRSGNKNLSSL